MWIQVNWHTNRSTCQTAKYTKVWKSIRGITYLSSYTITKQNNSKTRKKDMMHTVDKCKRGKKDWNMLPKHCLLIALISIITSSHWRKTLVEPVKSVVEGSTKVVHMRLMLRFAKMCSSRRESLSIHEFREWAYTTVPYMKIQSHVPIQNTQIGESIRSSSKKRYC